MLLESILWLNTPTFVARFLEDTLLPAIGVPMTLLQVDNLQLDLLSPASQALPFHECADQSCSLIYLM